VFEGFLPRKGRERRDRLNRLAEETRTVVLYEAPHRLTRTLQDLARVCGPDRTVVVGRELTKLYEESELTTLAEAAARSVEVEPRGEFVLVVAGASDAAASIGDDELRRRLTDLLTEGQSKRDAVAAVVADTGASKRRVYDLANALA
jgi:16S rRNA (cytidine1402-2'-O)-methyltransferase